MKILRTYWWLLWRHYINPRLLGVRCYSYTAVNGEKEWSDEKDPDYVHRLEWGRLRRAFTLGVSFTHNGKTSCDYDISGWRFVFLIWYIEYAHYVPTYDWNHKEGVKERIKEKQYDRFLKRLHGKDWEAVKNRRSRERK